MRDYVIIILNGAQFVIKLITHWNVIFFNEHENAVMTYQRQQTVIFQ